MRGTLLLAKLILRRDRLRIAIWISSIVAMIVLMPLAMHATTGSVEELLVLQQQFVSGSAMLNLISGPLQMIDGNLGLGSLTLMKNELFVAILIAFFVGLLITRHTRANEENGVTELILAGKISRFAPLSAALLVTLFSLLIITILGAFGMAAATSGLAGGWGVGAPSVMAGSWLFALEMFGVGIAFSAIAAVISQLTTTSSAANGILCGVIGATYLFRGINDVFAKSFTEFSFWSWISPFGWAQMTRSLTFANWWALIIPAIFSVFAIILAYILLARRDLGSGILPSLKGRIHAGKILLSRFGLALKLQKNIFIGWLFGTVILAVIIGGVAKQMESVYTDNEILQSYIQSLGGNANSLAIKTLLIGMLTYVVIMALAYTIQALGKLRTEESSGRTEVLLSAKLSRNSWLLRHVSLTALFSALILAISGFSIAFAANISGAPEQSLSDFTLGMLAYYPVIIAGIGIYIFLFGVFPRIAGAVCWLLFSSIIFMQMFLSLFVALFNLPESFRDFLPLGAFTQVASESAVASDWRIFYGTLLLGVIFAIFGVILWRRRDLANE